MAEVHGVAGEWARVKGTVVGLWPLFLGVFAGGVAMATAAFAHLLAGLVATVVALGFVGWSLQRGMRRMERFYKGARGEERVAGILRCLPQGYHVFNDFVAGRSHVDHVVVGPAGVFAVETKCWAGKVTVEEGHILLNGRLPDRPPLSQVLKEAAQVKAALAAIGWEGYVTPVLTFASDTFVSHRAELQGAVVLNSSELLASFATSRVVIPQIELDRLVRLIVNRA